MGGWEGVLSYDIAESRSLNASDSSKGVKHGLILRIFPLLVSSMRGVVSWLSTDDFDRKCK